MNEKVLKQLKQVHEAKEEEKVEIKGFPSPKVDKSHELKKTENIEAKSPEERKLPSHILDDLVDSETEEEGESSNHIR